MSDWFRICLEGDLPAGQKMVADIDETMVLVVNLDGELHAIEDLCTHDGGELASGEICDGAIACPRHGAKFCLKSGKALTPPAYEDVHQFPVRITDGFVEVRDDRWD